MPDHESTDAAIEPLVFAHPTCAHRYTRAGIHRISYPNPSLP
ncbi:MAG: hypothetical protein WAS23_03410 [Dokdonella sp.]|nr:hypothetical protein [Dokdonella sp.]HPG93445.1 hypothetical protein [Dokdonella sp.]HPN78616.1 hypothetical protein [Dokdonella sp.]